jgi:hypothetical protein
VDAYGNTVLNTYFGSPDQFAGDFPTAARPGYNPALYPFFTSTTLSSGATSVSTKPKVTASRAATTQRHATNAGTTPSASAAPPRASAAAVSPIPPLWSDGAEAVLPVTVSVPTGGAGIRALQVLVNASWTSASACLVSYDAVTNTLQLASDDAAGWSAPVALGGADTIANARCAIHAAGSAVSATDQSVTAVFAVTFAASFAGPKNIYASAIDAAGAESGWYAVGR